MVSCVMVVHVQFVEDQGLGSIILTSVMLTLDMFSANLGLAGDN